MVKLYLQRLDALAEVVGNIKPNQLAEPTPCAEYNVRALLNHTIGGVFGFAMAVAGEMRINPGDTAPDLVGQAGDDPAAVMTGAMAKAKEAWTAPGAMEGTALVGDGTPAKVALRIALGEAVIHGWDIATATHQPFTIPDEIAQPMLDGFRAMMGDAPRPKGSMFGPEVEVGEEASAADKLIAFTGRTP